MKIKMQTSLNKHISLTVNEPCGPEVKYMRYSVQ